MNIKVCGITNLEDARKAIAEGAFALGFIFYEKSPRCIAPEAAQAIIKACPGAHRWVGVFVNSSAERIREVIQRSGIDTVQLHGDETPEHAKALSPHRIWRAIRLKSVDQFQELPAFAPYVEAFLFDASVPGQYGGTGHTVDWNLLDQVPRDTPLIVSGGLHPGNVREAWERFKPYALDLSSGVEISPGKKDHKKLEQLFAQKAFIMTTDNQNAQPGYFGRFGGRFVPETLYGPVQELEQAYTRYAKDPEFQAELKDYLTTYVGRPTPLTFARRLTEHLGGAQIFLKREDLTHTGAHKINNAIGQVLLAKRMGKTRIVAETGAGQHGVATATACALLGLECVVYMGSVDMARQALNVKRMKLLGADVVAVESGSKTLKDAVNETMRDWVSNVRNTFYCLGSALGPHPYPRMVRDFHRTIGEEARAQILAMKGRLPDELVACVGGGSNAIGLFFPFLQDKDVRMTGVEAGGYGIEGGKHAARFAGGSLGVLHGSLTYLLQDENGQVSETHSISAGLDYPAVGPEHAYLHDIGRASYTYATDAEAKHAFQTLARLEGIIPALESSHAVAYALKRAPQMPKDAILLVNISGRGDKDMEGAFA